jgi:uncharacterized hydrophobic protein (TIGR00341 family)
MSLRLIELIVPAEADGLLARLPEAEELLGRWDERLDENRVLVRMLVSADRTEGMLDNLESWFAHVDEFRVLLLPVEATLPRPAEPDHDATADQQKSQQRISREELYHDVAKDGKVSRVFVAQVVLSTVVAAVGLMRDDVAIIIGAMVIAPLLGPNVSLCLATTLGDRQLAVQSLKTNALGLGIALVASLFLGLAFPVDLNVESILSRTHVSGGDIILALASGCAGVLAFTTGVSSALIGVMVAVALLPPFVVFGLLLASGEFDAASRALLLVGTNVICVNLAGVLTFAIQGLRPRTWWEAERAKKATRFAVATWSLLLAALLVLILLASRS